MADTERTEQNERVFVGTGLFWGFIVVLLVVAAVVVLAAQNPESITVRWFTFEVRTPLIVVILVTALVAVVLDQLIGLLWRRRRRRVMTERAELNRLRSKESGRPEPDDRPSGPDDRLSGPEGTEQT